MLGALIVLSLAAASLGAFNSTLTCADPTMVCFEDFFCVNSTDTSSARYVCVNKTSSTGCEECGRKEFCVEDEERDNYGCVTRTGCKTSKDCMKVNGELPEDFDEEDFEEFNKSCYTLEEGTSGCVGNSFNK